jgi:hypothetical protein
LNSRRASFGIVIALAFSGCGDEKSGGGGGGSGGSASKDLAGKVEACFKKAGLPDVQLTTEIQPEATDAGAEAIVLSHAPEEMNPDQVIVFESADKAKAYTDAKIEEDKAQNQGILKGVVNFASHGRTSVLTYGKGARQDKIVACGRENG